MKHNTFLQESDEIFRTAEALLVDKYQRVTESLCTFGLNESRLAKATNDCSELQDYCLFPLT